MKNQILSLIFAFQMLFAEHFILFFIVDFPKSNIEKIPPTAINYHSLLFNLNI